MSLLHSNPCAASPSCGSVEWTTDGAGLAARSGGSGARGLLRSKGLVERWCARAVPRIARVSTVCAEGETDERDEAAAAALDVEANARSVGERSSADHRNFRHSRLGPHEAVEQQRTLEVLLQFAQPSTLSSSCARRPRQRTPRC